MRDAIDLGQFPGFDDWHEWTVGSVQWAEGGFDCPLSTAYCTLLIPPAAAPAEAAPAAEPGGLVSDKALVEAAINGMLASHDPSIINDRLFMSLVIIAGALIVALAAIVIFTM